MNMAKRTALQIGMSGVAMCVGCGGPESTTEGADPGTISVARPVTAAEIPGVYFFQVNTRRGTLNGNWSFNGDGTFATVVNGLDLPAGTWTTDGVAILIVQNTPYGNSCRLTASLTDTGFASQGSPSVDVTCTFNRLKPNPPSSWFAIRLP
jgi:hypothetical protein